MSLYEQSFNEADALDFDDNENQDNSYESENEIKDEGVQHENVDESATRKITPRTPRQRKSSTPRLTTELLKGPKGVHTIEKYFQGFKFHGRGREKEDLERIMKRLEHWAYRIFPKLNFDDFLAKVEQLGTKKDLQVFLKKYRTNMISADDDLTRPELINDEDENGQDDLPSNHEQFDLLLTEQIEHHKQRDAKVSNTNAFDDLMESVNSILPPGSLKPTTQFSDKMKEKIEIKRKMAMEKKLATMKRLQELQAAQTTSDENDEFS